MYIQVELRDRSGSINGRLWNAGEPLFKTFEEGDFLRVRGKVQLFQGSLQVILSQLEKVQSQQVSLADYLPQTEQDVSKLLERLRGYLRTLSNFQMRALGESFLLDEDLMAAYCRAPAGVRNHHAYVGGLLEHVVNLLDAAIVFCRSIPNWIATCFSWGYFSMTSARCAS